jgi:RHS repeat-associated protein
MGPFRAPCSSPSRARFGGADLLPASGLTIRPQPASSIRGGRTGASRDASSHDLALQSQSESVSKLLSTSDSTEYGVPRTASPAKYSWLGSAQRPTELPSGVINMGARTYIPQLGRFLQPDPVPGGSANAYAYTFDDPVNQADISGAWTSIITYEPESVEAGEGTHGTIARALLIWSGGVDGSSGCCWWLVAGGALAGRHEWKVQSDQRRCQTDIRGLYLKTRCSSRLAV